MYEVLKSHANIVIQPTIFPPLTNEISREYTVDKCGPKVLAYCSLLKYACLERMRSSDVVSINVLLILSKNDNYIHMN